MTNDEKDNVIRRLSTPPAPGAALAPDVETRVRQHLQSVAGLPRAVAPRPVALPPGWVPPALPRAFQVGDLVIDDRGNTGIIVSLIPPTMGMLQACAEIRFDAESGGGTYTRVIDVLRHSVGAKRERPKYAAGDRVVDQDGQIGTIETLLVPPSGIARSATVRFDRGGCGERGLASLRAPKTLAEKTSRAQETSPLFKAGDRVWIEGDRVHGVLREPATAPNGKQGWRVAVEGKSTSCFYEHELQLAPEQTPPPLKFKVGDRVWLPGAGTRGVHGHVVRPWTKDGVVEGWKVEHEDRPELVGSYRESQMEAALPALFRRGDLVRLKPESRDLARPGEPKIMKVASIALDGLVIMEHKMLDRDANGGAPWAVEHLELVIGNTKCLRCGAPAFTGFFSTECLRYGGCTTAEQRVGSRVVHIESRVRANRNGFVPLMNEELEFSHDGWSTTFPTRATALADWQAKALAEEKAR